MSLVQGYSSDEEDISSALHDAFNLAAVPSTKGHRFEPTTSTTVPQAAPDVLAQVGLLLITKYCNLTESNRIHSTKLRSSRVQRIPK